MLFRSERPRALGIYAVGTYLGVFLGYFVGGYVNQHYGFAVEGPPGTITTSVSTAFAISIRSG